MTVWIPVIVAALGSLGSGWLASLFLVRRQVKKLDADTDLTEASAADTLAGVAVKLVEPLTDRLAEAEARASALKAALEAAQAELQDLRGEMARMSKELSDAHSENERLRNRGKR